MAAKPSTVLFGYESSPFTWKVRLVLQLKQVPYTFVAVPSMWMHRNLLKDAFNLTYRKIPVLAIGRDIYCDTSIIIEALEDIFSESYASIYPPAADGRTYRSIMRGFTSYWTDRPLFRVTTGLIPSSVWRTDFGLDRAPLIGHKLNPDKLEAKLSQNLSSYDMQCSMFESQLRETSEEFPWLFSTKTPSMADISLYYQLKWGNDIAAGKGINDLTGGGTPDTSGQGTAPVFNEERHPRLCAWFSKFASYLDSVPWKETKASRDTEAIDLLKKAQMPQTPRLVRTPNKLHSNLSEQTGLVSGAKVWIAPDDTGRDNPTIGTLVAISPEEVVIRPEQLEKKAAVEVFIHFPRLGFVVRTQRSQKL